MSNSNVQEVRDRIIQLAREIEEFSKSNVPPQTFFQEFLRFQFSADPNVDAWVDALQISYAGGSKRGGGVSG